MSIMNKEILWVYSCTDDRNHFLNIHQICSIDFIPNWGVILRTLDPMDQRPLEFKECDNPGFYEFLKSLVMSFTKNPSPFDGCDKNAIKESNNNQTSDDIGFLK